MCAIAFGFVAHPDILHLRVSVCVCKRFVNVSIEFCRTHALTQTQRIGVASAAIKFQSFTRYTTHSLSSIPQFDYLSQRW